MFDNGLPRCHVTGKVSWASKAEARARYRPRDRRRFMAFRCAWCELWHVGHR